MFENTDKDKDGILSKEEAVKHVTAMTTAHHQPKDPDKMSKEEFSEECSKGTFDNMPK
jgi:hypothetical protein